MDRCSSFTSHSFGKFRCFSIQKASAEDFGSIGSGLAMTTWLKEAKNDDRRENGLQAGRKDRTCHWWDKRDWSCYREAFRGRRSLRLHHRPAREGVGFSSQEHRGSVTGVQGDVSQIGDLERLFAQIDQEKGRLDIVFANAGTAKYAPLGEITEEFFDSTFAVNVKGLLFTVQMAWPLLKDGSSIVLCA